jgi:hypothetical protein
MQALCTVFLALGVLLLFVAAGFGLHQNVESGAPNFASAGAACGFAIAGGLCFLACATIAQRSQDSKVIRAQADRISELEGDLRVRGTSAQEESGTENSI